MKRALQMSGILMASFWANSANAAIDNNAAEVLLRKSCTENGAAINNCFTSLDTLNTWIWNTRKPGQTSGRTPLLVSIGPGKFAGQFKCDYIADDDAVAAGVQHRGHVTLRGFGVGNSAIEDSLVVFSEGCHNLVFEDLTLRSTNTQSGVTNIGGTTTWNNVEIEAKGYAWNDGVSDGVTENPCQTRTVPPGKHIWNNSRILATTGNIAGHSIGYYNHCDDALFLGSEITARATGPGASRNVAIFTWGGNIRIYGGAIRVLSDPGVIASGVGRANANDMGAMMAVHTNDTPAEVHIHGTGIDMISPAANNLTAIDMEFGGMVHANGAAYMLKTGVGGIRTRVRSSTDGFPTHLMAPYLWEPMAQAPKIISETGQDIVVITDTSDDKPHTLVYAESCASHWFDNNTNACDPVPPPP